MYKKAARVLAAMGYTDVRTYPEGIPGWVGAGYELAQRNPLPKVDIPTMEAGQLSEMDGQVTVVDIRTNSLYEMGVVANSITIPLAQLTTRHAEIPKDKQVVVVDHSGKQVLAASRYLKSIGFENVSRLQGGLMAWVNQGLPLETGTHEASR